MKVSGTGLLAMLTLSVFLMVVSAQPHPQQLSYFQGLEALKRRMSQAHESSPQDVRPDLKDVRKIQEIFVQFVLPEVQQLVLKALDAVSEDVSAGNLATLRDEQAGAPNFTVSQLCINQSAAVLAGLLGGKTWALQMLDAMGKPVPGISQGNFIWPGAYDQCQDVRAVNTSNIFQPDFSGRYCTAYLDMSQILPMSLPMPALLSLGICVPDSCSSNDLTFLVYSALTNLNVTNPPRTQFLCSEPDHHLDAKACVAIAVCSFFLLLMVTGTILDILYIQRPKWRMEDDSNYNPLTVNSDQHRASKETTLTPLLPSSATHLDMQPPQLGIWVKLFVAFSVYTNGSKLFSTKQAPGSLECVHGIRFLSMTWVVLGHVFLFSTYGVGSNMAYFQKVSKRWTFQVIVNAYVSVDTFFVLSGMLVAYLSLKEMKKRSGKLNWFLFYFHRFWRLTPAYMLVIMVFVCLSPYWFKGPFWAVINQNRDYCETTWWTNLLYINNLVDAKKICLGQSWYLSDDMQFYILSPLIFVPLYFSPVLGAVSSGIFLLVTSITPGILTVRDEFAPYQGNNTNQQDYMTDFYIKPYNRMGPYVVGMLAGYFLYRTNCKLYINKFVNLVIWAIAAASALAVLYGLYDHQLTLSEAAFYNAVNRQAWGLCVSWVVIACVTGNGGFVNTILSWSALVPLSRLTYVIYLIHLIVIELYLFNRKTVFYIDDMSIVMLFLGVLIACYLIAVVISLAFESPMMALEKVLLHPSSKAKAPSNKVDENAMSDGNLSKI